MRSATSRPSIASPWTASRWTARRCGAAVKRFRIQGTQAAGAPPAQAGGGRRCHRSDDGRDIAAGQRLRHSRRAAGDRRRLRLAQHRARLAASYHNVHRRGNDSRQGALLLEAGTLLRAPEIAVAASAGMARVRVSSQPAVMVVSTGDELIEPGDPIADYQVRRSNAYAVAATLRKRGFGPGRRRPCGRTMRPAAGATWPYI